MATIGTIKPLRRVSTGVQGLDDILQGGLPAGEMYLLEGDPGTGKTTIAMQYLLDGLAQGEKVLYVTLSEPKQELSASAASHGWDFEAVPVVEFVPDEASLSSESQYTVFHASEVELASTVERLTQEIASTRPQRLVIDSLSELRLLAGPHDQVPSCEVRAVFNFREATAEDSETVIEKLRDHYAHTGARP